MFNKVLVTSLVLSACVSSGPHVLERANNASSRPDWVDETQTKFEKDGKTFYLGYVEVPGDSSKSSALDLCAEQANDLPFKALVNDFVGQLQYGADLKKDSITFQEISSATRSYRPILSTFDVAKKYWETIALVGPDGQGSVDLRVFCLAEVNTSEVVKARKAFITQANGNPEIKQILKDIGQKQRDKVLNSKKPADDTEAKD